MNASNHLIIGYNGAIGSALFKRLQNAGLNVFGTTQRKTEEASNVFYLNLLDEPHLWNYPKVAFDVVYLCAGISRMAACEDDPDHTRKVNVEGIKALIKHFANSFIIYLSSNQVFSGNEPKVSASAKTQPLNEYGRQKAEVEDFIKNECASSAIVRLTKVLEPNMCLLKNWIRQLSSNLFIEAFHDMQLAPVSLRQVVDTLFVISQQKQSGIYQISGAQDVSFYEFARHLTQHLGKSPSLVRSVSALEKGMKNIFLPRHTTLECESTRALGGQNPPTFPEVVNETFPLNTLNTYFEQLQ